MRINRHSALTVCKHTVSGTLSLPFWGTFHHSLTVLSAIGHREYLVLPNGLGRFPRDSACPVVLGKSARRPSAFRLRGCPSVADLSRVARLNNGFVTPCRFGRNNKRLPQTPLRNGYR